MTTYADALAACTARHGAPTFAGVVAGADYAEWDGGAAQIILSIAQRGPDMWMDTVHGRGRATTGATWTLAGTPSAAAPLTPLPDALDAADAWLRGARSARG